MNRLWVSIGVVGCLIGSSASVPSAGAVVGAKSPARGFPSGCKTISYTADGGYFSQGHFFWEPSDTVTLTTSWCYSNGLVTSHAVSYSTAVPNSFDPVISTTSSLVRDGAVLDVEANGTYNSGVINNVGLITVVGSVTRRGAHHFADESGAGG
jgi:hypothetical protein